MKDQRITVRLSAELQAEITDACRITGLDEPTIIRECLKAFVKEVKASGEIRLPLAVVPKSAIKHMPSNPSIYQITPIETAKAAESPAEYKVGGGK